MTSKELLALNPGYNIDKIQIGEVLTLSEAVPYLTVTVKRGNTTWKTSCMMWSTRTLPHCTRATIR